MCCAHYVMYAWCCVLYEMCYVLGCFVLSVVALCIVCSVVGPVSCVFVLEIVFCVLPESVVYMCVVCCTVVPHAVHGVLCDVWRLLCFVCYVLCWVL